MTTCAVFPRGFHPTTVQRTSVSERGGVQTITMRYDGPDVFGLVNGGAAGFRINNMGNAIVTDYATLTIVPN